MTCSLDSLPLSLLALIHVLLLPPSLLSHTSTRSCSSPCLWLTPLKSQATTFSCSGLCSVPSEEVGTSEMEELVACLKPLPSLPPPLALPPLSGSHEQLYQEFLPLLSNLLQGMRGRDIIRKTLILPSIPSPPPSPPSSLSFPPSFPLALPLSPSLPTGLNRLQSGQHKQYMKDLFVELCLTVPVRLR